MADRYRIAQDAGGQWVIVHARESEWKWQGEHWSEHCALTFARKDEAEAHAESVFSPKEAAK